MIQIDEPQAVDGATVCYGSTHKTLVDRAARWLRNSAKVQWQFGGDNTPRKCTCTVVLTELVSSIQEIPDAIGWSDGARTSILIECKASRSDFLADRKKFFRYYPESGVGRYRYYMAPDGLLSVDEMPENWGLLNVKGQRVKIAKIATAFKKYSRNGEASMMFSALRRQSNP